MAGEASDKGSIRRMMRKRLDALAFETKKAASVAIVDQLAHLLPANATCALFHGTSREPELSLLFESRSDLSLAYPRIIAPGKMVFYHTASLSSLHPGSFGILEPDPCFPIAAPDELDFILCPGLAFTQNGHRLGQGGGYYDRYLPKATQSQLIGICFTEQILDQLPVEDHDFHVSDLVTAPGSLD